MPASLDVPAATEVEVSLFGPGLGEAIAVHVGSGEWLLVDSCFDDGGEAASLTYLRTIGVNPSHVACLVATHWDDDHIGGLSQTLEACTEALFCCSSATRAGEFLVLTESVGENSMMTRSGVTEFTRVVEILKARRVAKQRFATPTFAVAGRPLWRRPEGGEARAAELTALSPSDSGVLHAQRAIAELLPQPGQSKRRVRSPSPNRASVVLEVVAGSVRVLLGADLEKTKDPTTGWLAILDGPYRPAASASALKVPHHGSDDADEPRVWQELLEAEPVAILAPFLQGDIDLPREADRARLLARTPQVFTTSAQPRRRRRRGAAVERTLRESSIEVRDSDPPMGHVRLRRSDDDPIWSVDLFGPASVLAL